jgi:hypothetical protein
MPVINFDKLKTQLLIMHTMHQVGPANGYVERVKHQVITEDAFCDAMLWQLEQRRDNKLLSWRSWRAASSFSVIARSILSGTSSEEVILRCLSYLCSLRQTCVAWSADIKTRIASSMLEEQRNFFQLKAIEIALVCINTFNVEDDHRRMLSGL